jgi:hypothetical protein
LNPELAAGWEDDSVDAAGAVVEPAEPEGVVEELGSTALLESIEDAEVLEVVPVVELLEEVREVEAFGVLKVFDVLVALGVSEVVGLDDPTAALFVDVESSQNPCEPTVTHAAVAIRKGNLPI